MKLLLFTGIVFVLFLTNFSFAQSTSRKYVRIVVQDANTLEKATQIDAFIRLQSGVLTSRMDRQTGLYFAVFDANDDVTIADFISWIEGLGFTTKCFVTGDHGNGEPVQKLSRESCEQNTILQVH
jgi:hypothetical protein